MESNSDYCQRDNVRVEWVRLGEGFDGDYDPEDPQDMELLRFDVQKYFRTGEKTGWSDIADRDGFFTLDDASYCTLFPAEATDEQKQKALERLMDEVYEPVMAGNSIKKLCERLSWISLEWLGKELVCSTDD